MIDRSVVRVMLLGTLLALLVPPSPASAADPDGATGGAPAAAGPRDTREDVSSTPDDDPDPASLPPRRPSGLLAGHVFPIQGAHDLGQSATNGFGGDRGHEGQDVAAACGTPLVAAGGGTVRAAGYHGASGNYVVIDGDGTGLGYVYMHMLRAPLVRVGQRVRTGDPIGQVGETGRATGCHLHFELWSAPGWRAGGQPFDPLPYLRAWGSAD